MSTAARLSIFYTLVFSFYAVHLAYWPLWLKDRGLSDTIVGLLLAFGFFAKVVVNPVFRSIASRGADTRRALMYTVALAGAVFLLFGLSRSILALVLVQVAFFVFWVPVMPTTEYLALSQARRHGFDYGRVRLWGSVAFMLSSLLVGRWLEQQGIPQAYAIQVVFLAGIVLAAAMLPSGEGAEAMARGFSLPRLWSVPGLARVMLVAGLIQGSHAMLYAFSSIYWKSIGIGETVIGLLWAEGIVVEIVVFLVAVRLRDATGPALMLAVGGAAAFVRWLLLPFALDAPTLALLQLLHGASFALTHLGALAFVNDRVPESLSANAMALYSMSVMGLFMGLSALACGAIYTRFGGEGFWFMAILAAVGAALAMTLPGRDTGASNNRGPT